MGLWSWLLGKSEEDKKVDTPEPVPVASIKTKSKEVHVAGFPTAKVIRVFIPLKNFAGYDHNGNLLGMYKKGCRYFLREGNYMLQDLTNKWHADLFIIWEDEL